MHTLSCIDTIMDKQTTGDAQCHQFQIHFGRMRLVPSHRPVGTVFECAVALLILFHLRRETSQTLIVGAPFLLVRAIARAEGSALLRHRIKPIII